MVPSLVLPPNGTGRRIWYRGQVGQGRRHSRLNWLAERLEDVLDFAGVWPDLVENTVIGLVGRRRRTAILRLRRSSTEAVATRRTALGHDLRNWRLKPSDFEVMKELENRRTERWSKERNRARVAEGLTLVCRPAVH